MVELARRGFLLGIGAVLVTAPSIVHACNIMPIKIMDTFHKVWIEGLNLEGGLITEIIEVRESLTTGLDMAGYKERCAIIQPLFREVRSITWSNEINKVAISPGVDKSIEGVSRRPDLYERRYIDYDPPVGEYMGVRLSDEDRALYYKGHADFIPGHVKRGRTVALAAGE